MTTAEFVKAMRDLDPKHKIDSPTLKSELLQQADVSEPQIESGAERRRRLAALHGGDSSSDEPSENELESNEGSSSVTARRENVTDKPPEPKLQAAYRPSFSLSSIWRDRRRSGRR